jgi:hypothetical protein
LHQRTKLVTPVNRRRTIARARCSNVITRISFWWKATNGAPKPGRCWNWPAHSTPIVAILINGGAIAAHAVLQSVRKGSQLLVVEDTGRFADELSAAIRDRQFAKSATVSEIVGSACTVLFRVDGPAEKLRTELRRMLCD